MGLGWQELLIVLFIVLLLFGSTKLPQLMRSLGQGVGEFKSGMKDKPVHDEDEEDAKKA